MSSSSNEKDNSAEKTSEEEGIPLHLLKNLRKGESAESGSSNGESNSDNSALVSIGNTSFGFNFDSEEHSPNNSEDSDGNNNNGNNNRKKRSKEQGDSNNTTVSSNDDDNPTAAVSGTDQAPSPPESHRMESSDFKTSMSSLTGSSNSDPLRGSSSSPTDSNNQPDTSDSNNKNSNPSTEGQSSTSNDEEAVATHSAAAEDRASNLKDIATSSSSAPPPDSNTVSTDAVAQPVASMGQQPGQGQLEATLQHHSQPPMPVSNNGSAMTSSDGDQKMQAVSGPPPNMGRKRKADEGDSSAGYHTDDEGRSVTMPSGASSVQGDDEPGKGKKKRLDEKKREERNLREKERSLRISRQITELRNLLSSGGVIVPKGTKSSVLTEAANYIRMLQQHQYRSEL